MKYVIDASAIAAIMLPDEFNAKLSNWIGQFQGASEITAPELIQLEIVNLILMAMRRHRITDAEATQLLDAFDLLPITTSASMTTQQRDNVLRLADKHKLTSYDARYLQLAVESGLTLVTMDKALLKAAKAEGISTAWN